MKIDAKISAKITFTEEEKSIIAKFLQMGEEYSERCDTLRGTCDGCPFDVICAAGIMSVEEFKEALENIEEE